MRFVWGTGTDTGRVRTGNEDSLFPTTAGHTEGDALLLVADGMGGAVAGEVASKLATDVATSGSDPSTSPEDRILAANEAILAATQDDPSLSGMGTTMTLVHMRSDGVAEFAHVGDSRAYLLRDGSLKQLTTDHTLVNELVDLGKITNEEAEHHPHKHLLTRVLGLGPISVDTLTLTLQENDRILLCSDGLTVMVTDFTIEQILAAGEGVEPTAWVLIEQANMAGGVDNTTVVVIDVAP